MSVLLLLAVAFVIGIVLIAVHFSNSKVESHTVPEEIRLQMEGLDLSMKYLQLANERAARGEFDEAIAAYAYIIHLNPEGMMPGMYAARGVCYGEISDWKKAIDDFTMEIRICLNSPVAAAKHIPQTYAYRGLAYQKIGEETKADADFAKAKELGYTPSPPGQ